MAFERPRSRDKPDAAMHPKPEQMSESAKSAARRFGGVRVGDLRVPIRWGIASSHRRNKDVRQGIASRRRHVAPALLLC
jgi:hypothetical protein